MKWYLMDETEAEKYIHENLLLLEDYSLALSSGAMTPEDLAAKVYGYEETSKEYINAVEWAREQVSSSTSEFTYDNVGA
jgi:hypothetical protein